jgi:hypothetical protein
MWWLVGIRRSVRRGGMSVEPARAHIFCIDVLLGCIADVFMV